VRDHGREQKDAALRGPGVLGRKAPGDDCDARAAAQMGVRAVRGGRAMTPEMVLALQRTVGNDAVVRMLREAGHPGAQERHRVTADCGHEPTESAPVQRSTLHEVLRSSGRRLGSRLQATVETGMNAAPGSLDHTEVIDGPEGIAAAREVGAVAFTAGNKIVGDVSDPETAIHEAIHVLQQRRGPVSGTDRGDGLAVSDPGDHFEREAATQARRIQNHAAAAQPAAPPAQPTAPHVRTDRTDATSIQRSLTRTSAETKPTPAGAIKAATGVSAADQNLPGTKTVSDVDRPVVVSAEIEKKTLRDKERAKDAVLTAVTSMARAEEKILQGADLKKFYDGGHLVGDQLVAGDKTDSFTYWNVAPQISVFNTPAYAGVEDDVKKLALSGKTVSMRVTAVPRSVI
jgi:hypothetical protein